MRSVARSATSSMEFMFLPAARLRHRVFTITC
jgi:hypothetical protein